MYKPEIEDLIEVHKNLTKIIDDLDQFTDPVLRQRRMEMKIERLKLESELVALDPTIADRLAA